MLDRDAASAALDECAPGGVMAPSPENDTAPKAPDKPRHDKSAPKDKNKDDKTLSDLNDGELKGLLDEALNYKNPKDRQGKSKLFNHLLNVAEEDERNARAARAVGSELVRYCNPSAKRGSRHRKKPSSISENLMHGGSLDNLAKEELFETSKHKTRKSVSARQREGGSLPCNVNASTATYHEYQFLEEARKKKAMTEKKDDDVVEEQSLLEHDSLDQSFQEKANELQHCQYKYTSRASLQVNVSELGDADRNRTVEKKGGLQPRVPVFHVFMSRGGPDNEIDSPIQIPHLEASIDRKSCALTKSLSQYVGADCTGIRAVESKKVDENGNALHQNAVKAKKKKVVADKNVVTCSAEQVKGHRSDIINDMDKLMEFIGEKKPKQLNRHGSSEEANKSKKRAHSSKGKDGRSKLKKSNSLGEISTTNLDDFEFDDDDDKSGGEKARERRSWGNMEPLPLQNLYSNASAENLETAEFRVVTKKKKSKKRRNSISGGRSKTCPSHMGKCGAGGPSPDPRRKSACSVPHSEKSNDSSDVDSVHSLPIDTQRLDLATAACLNVPISYADIAKHNDRPRERRNDKVPKECGGVIANSQSGTCDLLGKTICLDVAATTTTTTSVNKNTPPDVHNIKNFPAINRQVQVVTTTTPAVTKNNGNKYKNAVVAPTTTTTKNVRNNMKTATTAENNNNNNNGDFAIPTRPDDDLDDDGDASSTSPFTCPLPADIPDVQTIEKMQLLGQGHHPPPISNCHDVPPPMKNGNDCTIDCDNDTSERTGGAGGVDTRPPVVILSGYANSKEVPGLVFGFDINEQLLSEDGADVGNFCCDDFVSRYVAPATYTLTSHNHDKIVSFIGAAWEEALVNLSNGKVQYYSDLL